MQKSKVKNSIHLLITIGVFFWIGVLVIQNAHANDLSGIDDPALLAAIEVWLKDNDMESLPVFASRAGEGNKAARLLLARIEATEQAASNFVSDLSRKDRIDLFRSNSGKGLFRPTWLKSEMQDGNKVAAVLLESSNTAVNVSAIRTLYEIGEEEAAYDLIREVAGIGSQDDKKELASFLPPGSELTPYLRALQNPVSGFTPGHAALQKIIDGNEAIGSAHIFPGSESDTSAAADFVEFGYQNGVEASAFDQTNSYYDDLANWIEAESATAPITTLCRRVCNNEDVKSCAITVFGLGGGYYKVIKFDSPLQALIEQSRYVTSDRAVGMLLRRISFVKTAAGTPMISDADLGKKSTCLAKVVTEVRTTGNGN
jgi:hypothetical protein